MAELTESARSILEAPNLAFVATVSEDGSPQVSPVWIEVEDGRLAFNTVVGNRKERNMRRDPRVAVSITAKDNFFDKVDILGRVVEMIEGEDADRQIDRLAEKYLGKDEYPWRNPAETRIKIVVEPVSVSK